MRFGLASGTMGRMSPQWRVLCLRLRSRRLWLLVASHAMGAASDLRMVMAKGRATRISMRPKTLFVSLCSAVPLVALLASQPSGAQPDPALSQAVRAACATDVRSLCAWVLPGGGRIVQCMRDRRDGLLEGCRDALAAARQAQQAQPRK